MYQGNKNSLLFGCLRRGLFFRRKLASLWVIGNPNPCLDKSYLEQIKKAYEKDNTSDAFKRQHLGIWDVIEEAHKPPYRPEKKRIKKEDIYDDKIIY